MILRRTYAAPQGPRFLLRCPARDALRGERHWFERAAQGSVAERKKMIDPAAKLSVSRQAIVLGISRSSISYQRCPVSDADLKTDATLIDKLHMEFPFAGCRMLQGLLIQEGFKVGRMRVTTLMKRMGIKALRAAAGFVDSRLS